MKKDKLSKILTFAVVIALGILIAIFGTDAIDIYLGIVACIAGAVVLVDTIYLITKKQEVPVTPFVLSCVLIAIGVVLFTHFISFALLVNFLVTVILGLGAGLLGYGIYLLAKKQTSNGLLNVVVGVVALTLAILYIAIPDFSKVFWIIVGIVIAVYGLLGLVFTIVNKD